MEVIMNVNKKETTPHPLFLDHLFTHKQLVTSVFKDVLGLYNIDHISISHINQDQELLTFSSTPALEYNVFSKDLWRFDQTYQSSWYERCVFSSWAALYIEPHYEELYYLKQVKYDFTQGLSFAVRSAQGSLIYSMATHGGGEQTETMFAEEHQHYYKIGAYCSNLLWSLFEDC